MATQKLIFVTGPTGCGKSLNAQRLADFFGCKGIVDGDSQAAIARMLDTVYPHAVLVITASAPHVIKHIFKDAEVHEYVAACKLAGISPFHGPDGRLVGPFAEKPTPAKAEWIGETPEETAAREKKIADELGAYGADLRVLGEILKERGKQAKKGYTASSDDRHTENELPQAAIAYALNAALPAASVQVPYFWPWDVAAFRPEGRRADMIKAAALLVAEIQRMDRAVAAKTSGTIDADALADTTPQQFDSLARGE